MSCLFLCLCFAVTSSYFRKRLALVSGSLRRAAVHRILVLACAPARTLTMRWWEPVFVHRLLEAR
eukprot:4973124-Pleurochrysis_carterae.AAC.2